MKTSYSNIWNFLEGKLSTKEEENLMHWLGQSERNAVFFNQVVKDFNQITPPSLKHPQHSHLRRYWAAACIFCLVAISIVLVNLQQGKNSIRNFELVDGSKISLGTNTEFEFDSISFDETKWIRIKGTAEITTKPNEHLLVETQNGYVILEGASSLQIRTLNNNDINVLVLKGAIKWLKPTTRGAEFAMTEGQNAVLKSNGKTISLKSNRTRPSTFLIFDNFMNL